MRFVLLFFISTFAAIAVAKSYKELKDNTALDFLRAGGAQSANEILLEDGSRIWVHGCKKGAKVTSKGLPAIMGIYKIKGTEHVIKVDENGNLVESIDAINSNMIQCLK